MNYNGTETRDEHTTEAEDDLTLQGSSSDAGQQVCSDFISAGPYSDELNP